MDSPDPDRWIEDLTLHDQKQKQGQGQEPQGQEIPKIEIFHSPTRHLLKVSLGDLALEAPIHPLLPLRAQTDTLVRTLKRFRADHPT